MRLIRLAVVLAVSLTLAPLAAEAQQAGGTYRIEWLAPEASPQSYAFRNTLHALGYVDGTNLVMDTQYAEGNPAQLFDVALKLVRSNPMSL
jgi:hypothetical protein